MMPTPVKAAALERALPVYEPRDLRAFARELQSLDFDLFVVASYGRILPGELIALPELGSLNVHPSLLPRYRGATPIQAALLDGALETGVTIMQMDEGMDTGDIVLQERVAIGAQETYGELHDRLAHVGARLLAEALSMAQRDGTLPHVPQQGEASVTRPISKGDLEIDWTWGSRRIVNHVRAYAPQPAARATLAATAVKITACRPEREREARAKPAGRLPGVILGTEGNALVVACGDGGVAVESLIAPNHRPESGAEFARRMAR